jgi:5-methylcytosine-specific restriction endonuclease McrA
MDLYQLLLILITTSAGAWILRVKPQPKRSDFYSSKRWRTLRYKVLLKRGRKCEACGAEGEGIEIHVDHIKPRYRYPYRALDETNLQILCVDCNMGKGAWDDTDWRK